MHSLYQRNKYLCCKPNDRWHAIEMRKVKEKSASKSHMICSFSFLSFLRVLLKIKIIYFLSCMVECCTKKPTTWSSGGGKLKNVALTRLAFHSILLSFFPYDINKVQLIFALFHSLVETVVLLQLTQWLIFVYNIKTSELKTLCRRIYTVKLVEWNALSSTFICIRFFPPLYLTQV